jgi:tetratricopeptide (TPR) repeat protein
LSIDPTSYNALLLMGLAYEGLENPQEAENCYRKAITISYNNPSAHLVSSILAFAKITSVIFFITTGSL